MAIHRGEKALRESVTGQVKNKSKPDRKKRKKNKINKKFNVKHSKEKFKELNLLDTVIVNDMHNDKLVNDFHVKNELTKEYNSNKNHKEKPTPVTIANVRGGKKIEKLNMRI